MATSTTTQLPGTVQTAAPGLSGFDTDTVINTQQADAFISAGYSFCIRYLSLGNGQSTNDLSFNEASVILNAGLALSAVQHVPNPGWVPSTSLGTTYGTNAASNAASIGLPKGMNLWCDLEGIATGTSAQQVIDYCTAWYNAVVAAGYAPGIYVGANCILTGTQLYEDLPFQHYWESLSNVPQIPNRGYQMIQTLGSPVSGVSIDNDTTQNDNEGGAVIWLKV